MNDVAEKAKKIKLLITDVDGVLTHGHLFLDDNGGELKAFHVHDGFGLILLMLSGVQVAVITGSSTPIVTKRMQQLGVKYIYNNCAYKLSAYQDLKQKLFLKDEEIAYIGDDLVDLPTMQCCGLSIAVANAVSLVQQEVHYITQKTGGNGAVREVCDFIMKSQNTLQSTFDKFLELEKKEVKLPEYP